MDKLNEEDKKALKIVFDHFDDEDRAVRDRQIRVWRRLKLLWENIQHTYYSEVAHDWRIPDNGEAVGGAEDQAYYDKPINIYRAYLESIIAALSVTVPPITCYPDDADNPLDLSTAKAGDKIAALIFRHNDAPLLWAHALFVFCTEGMTACYNFTESSPEYGSYEEKTYADSMESQTTESCPLCGADMGAITDEYDPQNEPPNPLDILSEMMGQQGGMQPPDMMGQQPPQMGGMQPSPDMMQPNMMGVQPPQDLCPNCGQMVVPQIQQTESVVSRLVETKRVPKSRIKMQVMGGLFVKVPAWARCQKECSYLIYSFETHFSNVLEQYPELRGKINANRGRTSQGSAYDLYEQWARLSPQYRGEYPENNVTVRYAWLRPCAFNILSEEEAADQKKKYPNGAKVTLVNDEVVACENEDLDDHWTLTYNPLSDYIHFDPLGLLLVSVQDITNDLLSLVIQTVEHGIPQTFADPKVLNFNAYRNSEVIPGGIYPATPKSGKALSEGFYEVRTATLSQEVLPFAEKVQQLGQMVSGALPSLFGGQMQGSRTASEYSMSRAQALQRLQTTWKMLTMWWKQIFGKVIPAYIKEVREDEKQVAKDEFGNFINVFVRKADLEGKIGSVELEANENLPITWNQQKDTIMQLFTINNEQINATLASPENMPFLKRAIGLTDYEIPGENDRQKQYEEIQQLINSEPIQLPPDPMVVMQAQQMGMPPPPPQEMPSVEVDPELDNHGLEADICRRWLVGDAGRLAKTENPNGYKNVLLHLKMHQQIIQQQQMQQMMQQAQMQAPQQKPPTAKPKGERHAPIQGEQDVQTVQ